MRIHADQLEVSYRGRSWSLDIDELTLSPGVTGLVGVNGAGKSTLMRVLSGAQRPSGGTATVDDTDLYARGRKAQLGRIGYMPQEFTLPRDVSLRTSLEYVAWLRGLPRREVKPAAAAALASVGLSDRATKRVGTLSGGMLRRLCLAQALVASPDFLLLDEPTTGLDPEQRATVRHLVEELPGSAVTLLSSHVMEDIVSLAEHLIVLEEGGVLYHGPLEAFRDEYGGPDRSAEHGFLTMLTQERAR
jgi:ABC-2 type transport system ATP-binding protein